MILKIVTSVLALAVFTESGYILLHWRALNRFKAVDDYGCVAFDTGTGQLCKTFQTNADQLNSKLLPSTEHSARRSSVNDPILEAIRNGSTDPGGVNNAQVEIIRSLPLCRDIR